MSRFVGDFVSGLFPAAAGPVEQGGSQENPSATSFPSPVLGERLRSSELIDNPSAVITGGYEEHLFGIGRHKSATPGIDHDVGNMHTENLVGDERPIVRTPVSGQVTLVKPEPWGTVRILDRNGWTHTYIHNQVESPGPLKRRYFPVAEGGRITKGDQIGYLSNRGTRRDHVHEYLQDPNGRFVDPQNVYRSKIDGAVEGIIDLEREEFLRQLSSPARTETWDERWGPLDDIA